MRKTSPGLGTANQSTESPCRWRRICLNREALCTGARRCILVASDRYDRGLSHTERMATVTTLQNNSNRKSLVKSYPVQSLFYVGQAADGCPVLLKESPSDAFHLTLEALAGIAQ